MADNFAKEVRDLYSQAEEADRHNREEAVIDLSFEAGFQWNEGVKNEREGQNLPCPTINVLQQYTGQVVGDWRANETQIKVLPREDGDQTIAEIRSELIRSIELQSKAPRIYASSLGQMVACGVSNFRVDIVDAYENPFQRDIQINDIPNPLAVLWDPQSFDPTGRDANYCFVSDEITVDEYRRRFKDAALPNLITKELGSDWCDGKTVQLPELWRIKERLRTFGMTATGKVVDLTDVPKGQWPQLALDESGQSIVREKVKCKYAVMVPTNGMEELADPYEVKLHRLPIIRVSGREGLHEGKRIRYGLIRFMRDSALMRNHNRAIRAELLSKFPRVNFIGPASAIAGLDGDWTSYLGFNDGAQMPVEVTGRNLSALIAEDQIYTQDLRDVSGIHEASLGMPSNEQSGVAIRARQQEGDVATLWAHDNMLAAQQEAGEICNTYIPITFDTPRTIRTVGPDLGVKMLRINDPEHKDGLIDLGVGTYDTIISTGPAYATRRQEGAAQLMELASRSEKIVEVAPDLIIAEMDLINGDKLQERLKRTVPPNILGDDANDDKPPEEQQADAQKAAQAEQAQQMGQMLAMRAQQAETALKEAQAQLAQANAMKAMSEAQHPNAGPVQDPVMMEQELRLKAAQADQAEAMAAQAQVGAMTALRDLDAGGDPEALQRLQIEAINAITKRIVALNPHVLQANQPEPPVKEAA